MRKLIVNCSLLIVNSFLALFVLLTITHYLLPISSARAQVDISKTYAFGEIKSLGQAVRLLVFPTYSIAATLVTFYFLIGAFKYLTSGGDKEAIGSARAMITHAIIGFIILILLFVLMQFLSEENVFQIPNIV